MRGDWRSKRSKRVVTQAKFHMWRREKMWVRKKSQHVNLPSMDQAGNPSIWAGPTFVNLFTPASTMCFTWGTQKSFVTAMNLSPSA